MASLSRLRKPSSPSAAKISATESPAARVTRSSMSANAHPILEATSLPTVVFPEAMKPTRKIGASARGCIRLLMLTQKGLGRGTELDRSRLEPDPKRSGAARLDRPLHRGDKFFAWNGIRRSTENMSVEVDRATLPCSVCGAAVTELRRGRCWGCYTRWAESPIG